MSQGPMNARLIYKFFEAANMQRWNDHIRPVELTELDKQSHKMVIAYVLAKFEETEKSRKIDWTKIIEGGIFEFLHRIFLTDLKPPVFHRLQKEKGRELNEYVFRELVSEVPDIDPEFLERFKAYHSEQDESIERRVLKAAHYLATNWEFRLIYAANPTMMGIEDTKRNIEMQIEDHYDLIGVQRVMLGKKSYGFIEFCGQLRYQQRWARAPRIPRTSVLGHMLMVAIMSHLCSLRINAGPQRAMNNFYTALFHDLPEVLTKDIITPVKKSVGGLEELIAEYEEQEVKDKLLPLLPATWRKDFEYLLLDPFRNRVRDRTGVTKEMPYEEINSSYNDNDSWAVDGRMLKGCDNLAAFIEAASSIKYGISSRVLRMGKQRLLESYKEMGSISDIDFYRLMQEMDEMEI
ncbi:MAG TPA: HD domain-containing protein [Methanomassiliicoccales archaeon]|nr:HD domain-containing protein [Methanomassiliicoccales archaeon]